MEYTMCMPARLPQFEGHNSFSLQRKYNSMLLCAIYKLGTKNWREVTVEEVEEWWKNSTRIAKSANLIKKEQQIVKAFGRIKQELGICKMV